MNFAASCCQHLIRLTRTTLRSSSEEKARGSAAYIMLCVAGALALSRTGFRTCVNHKSISGRLDIPLMLPLVPSSPQATAPTSLHI